MARKFSFATSISKSEPDFLVEMFGAIERWQVRRHEFMSVRLSF